MGRSNTGSPARDLNTQANTLRSAAEDFPVPAFQDAASAQAQFPFTAEAEAAYQSNLGSPFNLKPALEQRPAQKLRLSSLFGNSLLRSPSSSVASDSTSSSFAKSQLPLPKEPTSRELARASSAPVYTSQHLGASSAMIRDASNDDENCPVCLESLAMRLHGEKPHVVPICGHKLHEACFEAVYGPVAKAKTRSGSLGLCGVCRRDMKIGDPGDHGSNKFAAMAGLPGSKNSPTMDTHKMRSISKRTIATEADGGPPSHDPEEDDDLVDLDASSPYSPSYGHAHRASGDTLVDLQGSNNRSVASSNGHKNFSAGRSQHSDHSHHRPPIPPHFLAQPKITVRTEYNSISRPSPADKVPATSNITCMVTVELPGRSERRSMSASRPRSGSRNEANQFNRSEDGHSVRSPASAASPRLSQQPTNMSIPEDAGAGYTYGATQSTLPAPERPRSSSGEIAGSPAIDEMGEVVAELQQRLLEWKGNLVEEFGKLQKHGRLHIKKDVNTREFIVYLFNEALLCVVEDKRKGKQKQVEESPTFSNLRLKGRVYIKHIASLECSEAELSLTIHMGDEALDAFVLVFADVETLNAWHDHINSLVNNQQQYSIHPKPSLNSIRDSVESHETNGSRSTVSHTSSQSGYTRNSRTTISTGPAGGKEMPTLPEEDTLQHASPQLPGSDTPYSLVLPSLNLPHDLPAIDLMLIFSVPAQTNAPSSYHLKIRLIKSTLEFLIGNIGPRARISIVTYSTGEGSKGVLRKTPFLATGRADGRSRLDSIVQALGQESADDGGMVRDRDEKVNVLTAVNLALDVLLQRKSKSALSGIVLMNDGKDGSGKSQMQLVMARCEAAATPIHTFGWGKTHDPSSLWLLSNHTGGTYTFVKELYHLKDSVAGCVGGMLSVGATSMKLHISVPEHRWFRIRRVAGIQNAIVAQDGIDVDIDVADLRYGEKRELLVEVEMKLDPPKRSTSHPFGDMQPSGSGGQGANYSTATDQFFIDNAGLNPSSLDDYSSDFLEDQYDALDEEVPLFEVNASYKDPIAGKMVSRMPYPVLLMVNLTPPVRDKSKLPAVVSDPAVVRRRIELLCSDMETRCLLLMSRRNPQQAQRLLHETRRIVGTILGNLTNMTSSARTDGTRSAEYFLARSTLSACLEDIDFLIDGVDAREQFDTEHRNYAAQSAVILRDQRAWSGRTALERLFWKSDFSLWLAQVSCTA